jgi:hypothetical protein
MMQNVTTVMTAKEMMAQIRLRAATATLAKQQATKKVKQQIAAQGRRLHEFLCQGAFPNG